ncbi:MAG: hypothetical protein JSU08_01365 [Acidobacteria bacterium]|nr:hypothetical protein [Acidobacteriota bacterium]
MITSSRFTSGVLLLAGFIAAPLAYGESSDCRAIEANVRGVLSDSDPIVSPAREADSRPPGDVAVLELSDEHTVDGAIKRLRFVRTGKREWTGYLAAGLKGDSEFDYGGALLTIPFSDDGLPITPDMLSVDVAGRDGRYTVYDIRFDTLTIGSTGTPLSLAPISSKPRRCEPLTGVAGIKTEPDATRDELNPIDDAKEPWLVEAYQKGQLDAK